MASPDVSVLIPVKDEGALIGDTARTILDQRFDGSIEFLMIDGNSRDGTHDTLAQLAESDARVRVLHNPRGDLASALTIGLAEAGGEFVAKMDAHTYFPHDYLRVAVARLRRGDVNWVSGPPLPTGVDPWSRRVALALGTRLGVGGSGKWPASFGGTQNGGEKELDTGVFSGVLRRSVLERLGGWDPDWPVNEDSELASRYLAAGERILCLREMGARYVPRSSLSALARQYWRYGFYRVKTANRHPDSMRRSHLAPVALLATMIGAPLLGRPGRRLARACMTAYLGAQMLTAIRITRQNRPGDAALLPAVLTTMHMSFGAGWLAGCVRFGVPRAALLTAIRFGSGRLTKATAAAPDLPATGSQSS
jgi:succinoglycan biosynthesis protein ExoA